MLIVLGLRVSSAKNKGGDDWVARMIDYHLRAVYPPFQVNRGGVENSLLDGLERLNAHAENNL
jgi:hypothetical protein